MITSQVFRSVWQQQKQFLSGNKKDITLFHCIGQQQTLKAYSKTAQDKKKSSLEIDIADRQSC